MAAQSQGPPHVACQQCTQHCQRIHAQGFSRSPSFFSLLPPFPSSAPFSLPIPPAFLGGKNVRVDQTSAPGERLYSEMQLEGPSGAIWPVSMQGTTLSNLAFTTGWERFVKDHSLVAGDLLFFKLLSRGSFFVSIYGSDGCEKAEAFTAQNSGARSASNEQVKKRPAVDDVFQGVGVDAGAKKRKVDIDKQTMPLIIDIDDDDDEDEVTECATKAQSSNACQIASSGNNALIIDADIAETRDMSMLRAQESMDCMVEAKEEKCLQPVPVDVPLTPSNVDKGILANKMQTPINLTNKESNQEHLTHNTDANDSEQEAASFEEEKVIKHDHQQECIAKEEMSSESDLEKQKYEDSLYCTDEATQQDRMNDVLAKDYLTEAFISKRRPVSDEERERALQAAKRFRSNLPHLGKLMKESHVYRGFWLTLSSDFAIRYLPQEIQEATLLDASGKAWSARWLGRRSGLSGGWRKFSLDHGLEEGDVCVFEVIDRKKLVLKVHIFRVVELKNGLPGRDHYLRKPPSRPLLDYECRRPSTSVKKMRGAIACKTSSWHSSTLSSRLKQRNQGQAEDKKQKDRDDTQEICRKAKSSNHIPTSTQQEAKCVLLALQTPPKTREPVPENLRTRLPGLAPARELDPLLKGALVKAAKEHPDISKLNSCRKYYSVERLYNRRKGAVEEEFLVDLDLDEPLNGLSSKVKKDGNAWWVPLSHFTKDKTSCHL